MRFGLLGLVLLIGFVLLVAVKAQAQVRWWRWTANDPSERVTEYRWLVRQIPTPWSTPIPVRTLSAIQVTQTPGSTPQPGWQMPDTTGPAPDGALYEVAVIACTADGLCSDLSNTRTFDGSFLSEPTLLECLGPVKGPN